MGEGSYALAVSKAMSVAPFLQLFRSMYGKDQTPSRALQATSWTNRLASSYLG